MKLIINKDISDFLTAVSDPLSLEATLHSFILGIAIGRKEAHKSAALAVQALAENGKLEIACLQSDPRSVLVLSNGSLEAIPKFAKLLAEQLALLGLQLPGVNGPSPIVDEFAKAWASLTSCQFVLEKELRLFELQTLIPPPAVTGRARTAKLSDKEFIQYCFRKFQDEATPRDPKPSDADLERDIEVAIAKERYFVWEDNHKCVSWVGSRRETKTERWIAPVYTPKAFRGMGYGSALVAYVSKRILNSGKRGLLFTDLANPVSNKIYQNIGYKPVADFKNYLFDESESLQI